MNDSDSNYSIDKACLDCVEVDMNSLVPWFIMASYAYYVEEDPLISDFRYDRILKMLRENWDAIEHDRKDSITDQDLKAGRILGEYPKRLPSAVKRMREIHRGKQECS